MEQEAAEDYLPQAVLSRIRRELGAEWLPVSNLLARWKDRYKNDLSLIPVEELDLAKSLLPIRSHPFLEGLRGELLTRSPAEIDRLYKDCRRSLRKVIRAANVWEEIGLAPDLLTDL